jgi:hypothetical protein
MGVRIRRATVTVAVAVSSFAVLAVGVLAATAAAQAAHRIGSKPTLHGPGGVLHGCLGRRGGLRVIGYRGRCARREHTLFFGSAGATGPRGLAGPRGLTGPRGVAGARGPAGTPASTADITTLKSEVATLQSQVKALTSEVGTLTTTLAGVTRSGQTLTMSGLNLELNSGAGSTTAAVNGLGNLIIGYNASPGTQTGSDNLVIGDGQTFTSYGGLVAGKGNTINGPFNSVLGGTNNHPASGGCQSIPVTAGTC